MAGLAANPWAGSSTQGGDRADPCGDTQYRDNDYEQHCEVRDETLPGGDVRGRTRNGGVTVSIPDGYNAELEARTHNGGFRTDYPITVTGELNTRRGINTTLGSGGAPVRVRTSNGGLKINRR